MILIGETILNEDHVRELLEAIDCRREELKKVQKKMEDAKLDPREAKSKLECLWNLKRLMDPTGQTDGVAQAEAGEQRDLSEVEEWNERTHHEEIDHATRRGTVEEPEQASEEEGAPRFVVVVSVQDDALCDVWDRAQGFAVAKLVTREEAEKIAAENNAQVKGPDELAAEHHAEMEAEAAALEGNGIAWEGGPSDFEGDDERNQPETEFPGDFDGDREEEISTDEDPFAEAEEEPEGMVITDPDTVPEEEEWEIRELEEPILADNNNGIKRRWEFHFEVLHHGKVVGRFETREEAEEDVAGYEEWKAKRERQKEVDNEVPEEDPSEGPYHVQEVEEGLWAVVGPEGVRATDTDRGKAERKRDRWNRQEKEVEPPTIAEQENKLLLAVLTSRPGAEERWADRVASGLSDEQLGQALGHELEIDSRGIQREIGSIRASGGAHPQVFLSLKDQKTVPLRGPALRNRVRALLGIPYPKSIEAQQAETCPECLGDVKEGACTECGLVVDEQLSTL